MTTSPHEPRPSDSEGRAVRPPYGARTIKRERRTAARMAQLDAQILAELKADHPQSVRHLFYRMTDPRLAEPVEKSERGYRHIIYRCKELRRSGALPYGWISDASRQGYHVETYNSRAEFIREMAGRYRSDLWRASDYYVEVWCESRSIAGVIQGTCRDLAVSLYPCGGFSSITLAYEAAQYINTFRDRTVVLIYIGDYDPAGVLIDVALERELRQHLSPVIPLIFHRIAVTEQQIERMDLPQKPRKETDRRSRHVRATVEAEAIPAHVLRELVRDCVEGFVPWGALEAAKIAEQSEIEGLQLLAACLEDEDEA